MSKERKMKTMWLIRIATAITVLAVGIFFAVSNRSFDTCYDYIKSYNAIKPVEFQQGDTLEQVMTFTMDRIRSIGICVVERTNECAGQMKIAIVDKNNDPVWQEWVDIEALQTQCITWLDVSQNVELQKEYTLRFSADAMTGILHVGAVRAYDSSDVAKTNAVRNGERLSEPIVVEAVFSTRLDWRMRMILFVWALVVAAYILGFEKLFINKKNTIITLALTIDILLISIYFRAGFMFRESLNYAMFAGLVAAFVVVVVTYLFMLFQNIDKVEIYFAVSTLIFGIVYSVILPPYSMPDEEFHFAQSYRLSNAIMGQPINDKDGYIYMRECDINYRELCPNNEYTIDMLKALIRGDQDRSETMAPSECQRIAAVPVVMYVPQAIGITLGRLLHVNYARLVFMSRLMNLLVFILIVYWAIKMVPYGRWLFFAICQIPMLLETISSCSYDTPILALTFFFIAYLLKLYAQTERISRKQIQMLAVIIFFFAPLKPVYAPLIALVFLLPDENISDKKIKSGICKIMLVVIAVISLFLTYKCSIGSMLQVKSDVVYANAEILRDQDSDLVLKEIYHIDNNKPYQWPSFKYMTENPFNLIESLMGSYIVYADEYWMAMIGCGLGHLWDWRNPTYIGILTLILLYISYRKDNGQGNTVVDLKGRLWTILLVTGSLFGVFLAMYLSYSDPKDKVVGGVQGRYMLPLLVVLPLFLRKKLSDNGRTKTGLVMLSLTVQILAILNIAMQIWNY